jgi:hypothetical protein
MAKIFVGFEFDLDGTHGRVTGINQHTKGHTIVYVSNTGVSTKYRESIKTYFGKALSSNVTSNLSWVNIANADLTATVTRSLDKSL